MLLNVAWCRCSIKPRLVYFTFNIPQNKLNNPGGVRTIGRKRTLEGTILEVQRVLGSGRNHHEIEHDRAWLPTRLAVSTKHHQMKAYLVWEYALVLVMSWAVSTSWLVDGTT